MNRYVMSSCVSKCVLPSVIAAILLFSSPASSAQPIVSYNFDGQSLAASTFGPTTAGNISGGITGNASFDTAINGPYLNFAANFIGSSQADALTNAKYVSFTIAPSNGVQFEYSSLFYRVYFNNVASNVAGTGTVETRWSLDSFAAPLSTFGVNAISNQFKTDTTQFALPGTSGNAVEFRVYFFAYSNASNLKLGVDEILVQATPIPVPEPGSLGLILLSGGFLALRAPARAAREARSQASRAAVN